MKPTGTSAENPERRSPLSPNFVPLPPNFVCPLTMDLMREPLMDHDGHNFEKDAILEWTERNSFCPITQKPLETDDLVPNDTLRSTIRRWMEKHQYGQPDTKAEVENKLMHSSEETEPTTNTQNEDESMELGQAIASLSQVLASKNGQPDNKAEVENKLIHSSEETEHAVNAQNEDESMELGQAIASLSQFLASKEGYTELIDPEGDKGKCNVPEADDDSTTSLLYTLLLPQEREAIARMQQYARERQEARRLARIFKAGVGISVALISLVVIVLLAQFVRLHLLRAD